MFFPPKSPPIKQQEFREKLEIGFQYRTIPIKANTFSEVTGTYNYFKIISFSGALNLAVEIDNSGRWFSPIGAEFTFPECFKTFRIYNFDATEKTAVVLFGIGDARMAQEDILPAQSFVTKDVDISGATVEVLPENKKRTLLRVYNIGLEYCRIGNGDVSSDKGDFLPVGQFREYYSTAAIYACNDVGTTTLSVYWEERA